MLQQLILLLYHIDYLCTVTAAAITTTITIATTVTNDHNNNRIHVKFVVIKVN